MQGVEYEWLGCQNRTLEVAITVQAEFEKVGKNEIRERGSITLELFGFLNTVQSLFARFLGFDIADDVIFAIPETKIRIPPVGRSGKGGHVYVRSPGRFGDLLHHFSKRRVKTLLPGIALINHSGEITQIG